MKNITFNGKGVVEYFELPYGKNTLFKKLRELGFLDHLNYPSKEMLDKKLIYVKHPISIGFRPVNVPIFTSDFLAFIEKYLVKNEAD